MKEDGIILKDLKKYLKGKGLTSMVEFQGDWFLTVTERRRRRRPRLRSFSIFDGLICPIFLSEFSGVSLADPKYKEKFYEYLKENNMGSNWTQG